MTKLNVDKDYEAAGFITHKCRLCGNISTRPRGITQEEHKCQYCIKSQIDNR